MRKLNSKDKTELALTAGLIVVFIGLLLAFLNNMKTVRPAAMRFTPKIFVTASHFRYDAERNKGTPFILDKASGENIDVKRDPFVFGEAGSAQAVSGPNLSLKGIIWSESSPSAVINDQVLVVGDEISGYKVTQILENSVILTNEKSSLELKLN